MNPRRATPADVQGIAETHVASWQAAYRGLFPDAVLDTLSVPGRRAQWQQRLATVPWGFWVTGPSEQVTGFVSACPSRDLDLATPEFAEVGALYVRAEAWDTGCGAALCRAAFDDMREVSAKTAFVWVLTANVRARRFYERMGFVADGSAKDITLFDVTLPEVRYRRPLG